MAARARSSLPMPSFYHATLQLVRYKSTQHNGNSDDVTKLLPTAFDQVGNKQKPAGENDGDQVKEDSNKSTTDIPPPALSYPPEHYFDTHQIVTNFQAIGYSLGQSEILVSLMAKSIHSSLKPMWASMITLKDKKLVEQSVMSEIKALQNDIELKKGTLDRVNLEAKVLEKEDQDIHKLFMEELRKLQSGLQVDLNNVKWRFKVESTVLQQQIKDTNSKLSCEVAQLKTLMAQQKLESFKYLAGGIISVVTIVISATVRLWKLF